MTSFLAGEGHKGTKGTWKGIPLWGGSEKRKIEKESLQKGTWKEKNERINFWGGHKKNENRNATPSISIHRCWCIVSGKNEAAEITPCMMGLLVVWRPSTTMPKMRSSSNKLTIHWGWYVCCREKVIRSCWCAWWHYINKDDEGDKDSMDVGEGGGEWDEDSVDGGEGGGRRSEGGLEGLSSTEFDWKSWGTGWVRHRSDPAYECLLWLKRWYTKKEYTSVLLGRDDYDKRV